MSGSGVGRGRGWLNLNKSNPIRPGGVSTSTLKTSTEMNDPILQEFNNTGLINPSVSQYSPLINLLELLSPTDDGILLNQKLKHICQEWESKCNSNAEIEESFKYVYDNCLLDSNLASKLALMMVSFSPTKTNMHKTLRMLFLKQLQTDFENGKQMQTNNSNSFRNMVRMLGEFYHKKKLLNGLCLKWLGGPVIHCLKMLLEAGQPADLELFTSQLYLNGSSARTHCPTQMETLLMQVRQLLISNLHLTQICRTWMLLALDVIYHRFGLLPSELHKFYQEQLGDKAMANFQVTQSILSIQTTYSNKILDDYQSLVNVLQVTPPESTSPIVEQTNNARMLYNSKEEVQNYSKPIEFNSQNLNSDSDEWGIVKDNKQNTNNGEKIGRPILGAGARLQRSQTNNEIEDSKWKDHSKENSTGWDKKKVSGKSWDNNSNRKGKTGNKSNRKWGEHDDRFDTDY